MSEDWRERLRGSGYRLTPQRELVLAAVEKLGHATPEDVLAAVREQSSAINASTVYRNLEVLEELGLIRHAHLSERGATYHSATEHEHFHLVCRKCQRVTSVAPDMADDFVGRLQHDYDFEADLGHLVVFGTCTTCEPTDPGEPDEH